jgi:hypothetical protein
MIRFALIAVLVAAGAGTAHAHDYGSRIDAREAAQARRIEQGRRNGQLTWYETRKLLSEQRRIHRMEAWARRDGYISREEAVRIGRAQNRAARHIYQESHDGQTAWRRRVW